MTDTITIPRATVQQALDALEELDGLDTETECVTIDVGDVMDALRAALEQKQAEPDRWVIEKVGDKLMLNGKEIDPGTIELRLDGLTYRSSEKVEVRQQAEPVACGGEQEAPYIGHDCDSTLPDTMKVFCPACCTKFRAIPTSVQKLLLDAGFEPPFTTPPQQQAEPVASIYVSLDGAREFDDWKHELPVGRNFLFTAALQRKPLTDEQVKELFMKDLGTDYLDDFVCGIRAAEAAHGIK